MKNNLSDLKIIFVVTSILVLMIVLSSLAHPMGTKNLKGQYAVRVFQDTSYSTLSTHYPILISYLRKQYKSSTPDSNEISEGLTSDRIEKKRKKVYYWMSYKHIGQDEELKVNGSHKLLDWCEITLHHRDLDKKVYQMKEPLPVKVQLFHF